MENTENLSSSDFNTMPENNLTLAIIATVLGICSPCCIGFILGIIAIIMATQVKKKFEGGDYAAAEKNAKTARILAFVAIGLTVLNFIYVGLNWESSMEQYQSIMEQYGM